MSIQVAESAGFCFGVNRAVELVERVARNGKRVCTLGPIIHNRHAVAHFEQMGKSHRCEFCHYRKCYESIRGMALVRWMQGRIEEARELFRKVLEINPHCGVSQYYLTKAKPKKRNNKGNTNKILGFHTLGVLDFL